MHCSHTCPSFFQQEALWGTGQKCWLWEELPLILDPAKEVEEDPRAGALLVVGELLTTPALESSSKGQYAVMRQEHWLQ